MDFLRGVETALAVAVLVDLVKSLAPKAVPKPVKLLLVIALGFLGAAVLVPGPGQWRSVAATAMVGAGLAPLIHETHSVLSTFVDTNIRKVLSRTRQVVQEQARPRRSSREIPPL